MAALLEISGLASGYGKISVLQDVSLSVDRLETVSVLGGNGAGKTTLLNTIAGVLKPNRGKILFNGEEVSGLHPEKLAQRGMSLVLQGRSVFPFLTVQENLDMGAYLVRDPAAARSRLDLVCHLFPVLSERKDQWAGSMSGGEQKMLELGRAMMLDPKLLMLDEPSLGLAPLIMNMIFRRIREFRERGLTVLLVEQNVPLALEISDRGYLLELGRIRMEGKQEDLLRNPEIKKYYLGIGSD
jgi:branched-chain amino acid transport system ATP-binding protein